jgi:hypothetical protein
MAAICLASPEPAQAHVDLQPRLVEHGQVVDLQVELPSLRPGAAPARLEVEGTGVEVLSSRTAGVAGGESRWLVRARIDSPPGPLALVLRAVYADGASVEVRDSLTVLPASGEDGGRRWWVWLAGVVLATGIAAATLIAVRRKAW